MMKTIIPIIWAIAIIAITVYFCFISSLLISVVEVNVAASTMVIFFRAI